MGDGNNVEVNGKTYGEDTKITFKAKTLLWIIGILISGISTLATVGYLNIKSDIKAQKDSYEDGKNSYKEAIKIMLDNSLKDEVDKREAMYKDIYDIKGDIKVILDRTSGGGSSTQKLITSPELIPTPKHGK